MPAHLGELGLKLPVVEAVRAVGSVAAVGSRDLVVVGDEHGAGDAPLRRIGLDAGLLLAFGVVRPVGLEPVRQQEVGRQRMKVALAHRDDAFRERRDHGADDLGTRLLVGLGHHADAEGEVHGLARRDLEAVAGKLDVVGRLALPDGEDHVDRLGEHLVAVLVEDPDRLGVGGQRAGAHAEDEAPFRQVIEHRRLRRHQHRVLLRQVAGAARKLDALGRMDQRREKQQRIGDVLRLVGEVLADEHIVVAEPVGKHDRLPVLLQRLGVIAVQRVHRHHEHSQLHLLSSGILIPLPSRSARA